MTGIFRLVHTIKGTCGFLGLSRLEALTHAAEAVVSLLRDGKTATPELVTLILATVDRIKLILNELETHALEPQGDDTDIIEALESHRAVLDKDVDPDLESDVDIDAIMASPPTKPTGTSVVAERPMDHERQKRTETIRVNVTSLERIMVLVSGTRADPQPVARNEPAAGG